MLGTTLLSGGDRYVALPQLLAYAALTLCVFGLARRLGLGVPEALFGALAFATLPVVALQASGALNDLVVASFLAAAAVFALRSERTSLILVAVAIGLAVGTKFTAVLALPTLAFVVALSGQVRRLPGLAVAGACGLALGAPWYLANLVETGDLDGGLAEYGDQRADASVTSVLTTAMRSYSTSSTCRAGSRLMRRSTPRPVSCLSRLR
jgi:4-amino-4-deoxy-L-arabinose transferase-like glycosyltransferase